MAIDPNIPLQVIPPKIDNPADVMERQQRAELTGLAIIEKRRQFAAEEALNTAMSRALNPDGTIDMDKFGQAVANTPAASSFPKISEQMTKMQEARANLKKANQDAADKEADHIGASAISAEAHGQGIEDPQQRAEAIWGQFSLDRAADVKQGLMDRQTASQLMQQGLGPDGHPSPALVDRAINDMKVKSAKQRELSNAEQKTLQEGTKPVEFMAVPPEGGQPVLTQGTFNAGAPPGQQYRDASGRVVTPTGAKPTAEQDDNRYRNIQAAISQKQPVSAADLAWAKGYETQKTLGPQLTTTAADERQMRTIEAQIAQQGRAQNFTESQAGRKEYTDKVATPYQTSMTSAQTLRDTVAAAKAGNKIAGGLQSLETTMAAIRSQGLNRINTVEIGSTANAGSLWDRVQNAYGKLASGQPIDASLQKDMLQFADILEKSATLKYQKGKKSIEQTYGIKLPDESEPTGGGGGEKTGAGGDGGGLPSGLTYQDYLKSKK